MINKNLIVTACLSMTLLAGCSTAAQPPAPPEGSVPNRPLNAEIIDISDLSLVPFPAYASEGWGWQLTGEATSSARAMRLNFYKPKTPKLSVPFSERRSLAFDIRPDIEVVASDISSTTITVSFTTQKTRLPIYASYINTTGIHLRIVAAAENERTPCDDDFEIGYPFIMSSLRFEKTRPARFGGISFDHAIETMRSKETSVTYDFYRAFHNGLCISIMKTVDTGNLTAEKGESVKRDFELLLNSLRFF